MATILDHSVGLGIESTFGTLATPTRWHEWLANGSTVTWNPEPLQGQGLRVGSYFPRSARRRIGLGQGQLTIKVELLSKGLGQLLQAAFGGSSASNLVSGTTYQQVHSANQTGLFLGSRTIQCGIVDANTGAVQPHTFTGCTVSEYTIDVPENGIATLEVVFNALRVPNTATALTAPVMVTQTATSPVCFEARDGQPTVGGTIVVPTNTALATGGTNALNWRSFRLKVSHQMTMRPNMGGYAQPVLGLRTAQISGTVEYTDNVLRDAYLTQSEVGLTCTLTSPEALSTGFAQFQIVAPATKLNSGAVPTPTDGEVVTLGIEAEVLEPAGLPLTTLYVATRTADAAL